MVDFQKLAQELAHHDISPKARPGAAMRAVIEALDADTLKFPEAEATLRMMMDIIDPQETCPGNAMLFSKPVQLMYGPERKVLILREKHDVRHIGIDGPEQFAAAMLSVVDVRLNASYYGDDTIEPDVNWQRLETTAREEASEILELARMGQLRRAGRYAYGFLQKRSSSEYEEIDVIELETPLFSPPGTTV
jgi:hypothetical protein